MGQRRAPDQRFSELQRVDDIEHVDGITETLVDVTQPDGNALRIYSHVVSEALNNVCQHSDAGGFCLAQYYPNHNRVRVCIADYGIGLRQSLAAFQPDSDQDAIDCALAAGVTGRAIRLGQREVRNRGIGLSAIRGLVTQNQGELMIWSGTGIRREGGQIEFREGPHWQGTLISVTMPRNEFPRSYRDVMRDLDQELRAREQGQVRRMRRLP